MISVGGVCSGPSSTGKTSRVIVVDDDEALLRAVTDYLANNDITASAASNRSDLKQHLVSGSADLIVLDLQLGDDDGLDVLRELRLHSDVPVIILTGHRLDEGGRVACLECGADNFIVKPVNLRGLLARVRAILRRQEIGRTAKPRKQDRGGYRFGGWQLQRRDRRLVDPKGALVPLSKGEYSLLLAFLDAPQCPLSRDYLLQATSASEDIFDRSIDILVMRLRRKLERDLRAPRLIQTERGVGYVFAIPVEPY